MWLHVGWVEADKPKPNINEARYYMLDAGLRPNLPTNLQHSFRMRVNIMARLAKFNIGDVVLHARQGYRAVVVDIDPLFQASGHYNPQAAARDFATKNPWYRLLVDGSSQMTYVEECLLLQDCRGGLIDNQHTTQFVEKRN